MTTNGKTVEQEVDAGAVENMPLISISPLHLTTLEIPIVGVSPLIVHASGMQGSVGPWLGVQRQPSRGWARRATPRDGEARRGQVSSGKARQAGSGVAGPGQAGSGAARRGLAIHGSRGEAWTGVARPGAAPHGEQWQQWRAEAGVGLAGQGWLGHGMAAGPRRAGAGRGVARHGTARRAVAGITRRGRCECGRSEIRVDERNGDTTMSENIIEGGTAEEREAIQNLYDEHGHLTTAIVLDAASDETSPLHESFTWDDTEAAHKFRLQQAGHLIKRFKIRRPLGDGRVIKVSQFTRTDDGTYIDTRQVVTMEDLRDQKRLRILTAMDRLRRELADFEEFAELVTAIDALLDA